MAPHRTHVIDRSKYTQDDAIEALEAYGFREVNGVYIRFVGGADHIGAKGEVIPGSPRPDLTTERYVPVEGGFLVYKLGADLMGRDVEGGLSQLAYGVLPEWEGMTGLAPRDRIEGDTVIPGKPQCFEWVWPAGHVAFLYNFAESGWRRETDEAGVERMIWEGESET